MNNEKYLPLGSVVLLKNGKKRVMVIGFVATTKETTGKVYDYMGCLYPEGVISSEQSLVFNHNQIDKVFSVGFSDDDEKAFQLKLKELVKEKFNQEYSSTDDSDSEIEIPITNIETFEI